MSRITGAQTDSNHHNITEESPILPQEERDMAENHSQPITVSSKKLLEDNLIGGVWGFLAQLGLATSILTLWFTLYTHPAGLFSYHPAFQSLAILGFTEGVLLLQPTNTVSSKKKGLQLHQVFQYTALPISRFIHGFALPKSSPVVFLYPPHSYGGVLIGAFVIIYNKFLHNAKHFTTWHAKCGLITVLLILAQIIFGAFVVYAPLQSLFGGEVRAKKLWKFHRTTGYLTLILLYISPVLALKSDWIAGNSSGLERWLMALGFSFTLLSVVMRIRTSKMGWTR